MTKLSKLKLGNNFPKMSEEEMKLVVGGSGSSSCPSGQFHCSCNGTSYGCVSSTSECWNKC